MAVAAVEWVGENSLEAEGEAEEAEEAVVTEVGKVDFQIVVVLVPIIAVAADFHLEEGEEEEAAAVEEEEEEEEGIWSDRSISSPFLDPRHLDYRLSTAHCRAMAAATKEEEENEEREEVEEEEEEGKEKEAAKPLRCFRLPELSLMPAPRVAVAEVAVTLVMRQTGW